MSAIGTRKTALTEVTTDANRADPVGSIIMEGGVWYKYVKFKNTTATVAGVAGDPVIYAEGVTIQGYVNNIVCCDSTDGDTQPTGAGFLMAAVTGTAGTTYYLWIQIHGGVVTVPLAVTSGVVGSACMPTVASGTDKTLVVATGVINMMCILLTATAANNKVIPTCPF